MEVQSPNQEKVLKTFSPRNVSITMLIGLAVIGYIFYNEYQDPIKREAAITGLSNPNWMWLLGVFFVLFIRDAGYAFRIRHLTNKELSVKGSIYTILLWEFASAVTPSVVGGTAVAVFILNREGIKLGKSLAYVMLTAILDNFYFIVAAPLFIIITGKEILTSSWAVFFGMSYGLIVVYNFLMVYGLLIQPKAFKTLLVKLTSPKFLKAIFLGRFAEKLRNGAEKMGDEMVLASKELKGKNFNYWFTAIASTVFIWTARYFMLNCLIATFSPEPMSFATHVEAFANQILLWITQLVSPTPGASGFSEGLFPMIFADIINENIVIPMAFIWRLVTFYLYLIIGLIALRKWIPRTLRLQRKRDNDN